MTTITLQNTKFEKTQFQDVEDLFAYIIHTYPMSFDFEMSSPQEHEMILQRGSALRTSESQLETLLASRP